LHSKFEIVIFDYLFSHFLFDYLTYNRPKYLEWNLASEQLGGFFPLKYAISSFG